MNPARAEIEKLQQELGSLVPADTGGPAFPLRHNKDADAASFRGMTLRDYFAGRALEGMMGGTPGPHLVPPNAAKLAYDYADAMIAERSK